MRAFFTTGPVVQRPSIRPCQGRDRRFESGRDRSIELLNANSGATKGFDRTLTILPSRIRMISKVDQTDLRLRASRSVRAGSSIGTSAAAATVPNLALGIAAGIWLDRVQRRPVMVAADFGRAVVLASVPVAYVFGVLSLPQLYLIALIGGSLNVLFDIASGAYLPLVVPRMQLVEANAKLQAAIVGAQAAGPSIGGALVTLLSAPMAIVVDAVSFVIS